MSKHYISSPVSKLTCECTKKSSTWPVELGDERHALYVCLPWTGEGNSKKASKKRAAEGMLEKLNALPPLPPSVVKPKRPVPAKKKSKNIIKVLIVPPAANSRSVVVKWCQGRYMTGHENPP